MSILPSSKSLTRASCGLHLDEAKQNKPLSAGEQAEKIEAVLSGDQSKEVEYERKQVMMNAALRYYLFKVCPTIEEGIHVAEQQLQEQAGLNTLRKWRASFTNR